MRTINKLIFLIIVVLSVSCEKNDKEPFPNIKDGFGIVINDSIVYNYTQIDFYDFSSHLVYLKDGNTFSYSKEGTFRVFANKSEIYTGKILSMSSSTIGDKPIIECEPSFFNDYIIAISFFQITDSTGKFLNNDPRGDSRIIEALKKYNQYFKGLSCTIDTINFISNTNATVSLVLTNNDNVNYYYLDPEKMGNNLFHYFTNGLYTFDNNNYGFNYFFNKDSVERPKPYISSWDKNWLSLLKSKESTKITISYNNFKPLSKGTYNMFFDFPGLSWVEKKTLQQENGRIWLGNLHMEKKITIK
jgi:hypothetical protein